jgi:hypothetical protein
VGVQRRDLELRALRLVLNFLNFLIILLIVVSFSTLQPSDAAFGFRWYSILNPAETVGRLMPSEAATEAALRCFAGLKLSNSSGTLLVAFSTVANLRSNSVRGGRLEFMARGGLEFAVWGSLRGVTV